MDPASQTLVNAIVWPGGGVVVVVLAHGFVLRRLDYAEKAKKASDELVVTILQGRIVDLRTERDVALTGWREQTTATNRLAESIERDRDDRATRRRGTDRDA